MGLIDWLKRWQLAQQGLSSGKKRRVRKSSPWLQQLEESIWVKYLIYFAFVCANMMLCWYGNTENQSIYMGICSVCSIIGFVAIQPSYCQGNSRLLLILGGVSLQLACCYASYHVFRRFTSVENIILLSLPFILMPLVHGILLGKTLGVFSVICSSILVVFMIPKHLAFPCISVGFSMGMVAVLCCQKIRRRSQILQAGLWSGLTGVIVFLVIDLQALPMNEFVLKNVTSFLALESLEILAVAIFLALLVSGVLPILESCFQISTDITWLELGDLNHRLLKRLQLEAPGTFHHSLVLASLAEAAAEKIDANAAMCRTCAYFHDIGKLNKPDYFIENQSDGEENPHDQLTPTMSALVIIAHVKEGVDLAIKHRLHPKIIDIIQEHHGDSLVAYFYRKAQEQQKSAQEKTNQNNDLPKIDEKNFRYPGPRPQSKESSILCLADTIESASRTLQKPNPAKIRAFVDDLVEEKLASGMLDESPLSMREIILIKESFTSTLKSMMHSRISYKKELESELMNKEGSASVSDEKINVSDVSAGVE